MLRILLLLTIVTIVVLAAGCEIKHVHEHQHHYDRPTWRQPDDEKREPPPSVPWILPLPDADWEGN